MEIRADQARRICFGPPGSTFVTASSPPKGRTVIDLPNKTLTYFIEGQRSSETGGGPLARTARGTGK